MERTSLNMNEIRIAPQPGPQEQFLQTVADIAIYGGAAGGGKTYALLLEPLRHLNNPRFGCVIFRKQSKQIRNQGGLWHESLSVYLPLGAHPRESYLDWQFPKGMQVKFDHLENDMAVYKWQGSQIPLICFDELTHFSDRQFFYMLSRNRSSSKVPGYVRATTNPDADSWVRGFIDWWIDENGYPIPSRGGQLRWFIRRDDTLIWGDNREDLLKKFGPKEIPKSVTFIASNVHDNRILMENDPSYIANLRALSKVDRERLEKGNWNIKESAGTMFRREWFPVIDAIPAGWIDSIRFWDRAGTVPHEKNKDPDWTRGLKLLKYADGSWVVADLKSTRATPGQVETLIKNVASHDGVTVKIMSQQDPGSAGVQEAENFVRMLAGYWVETVVISKDKVTRSKPVSAQAEAGNIRIVRAPWNEDFFRELENFPDGAHDDIVDTLSGAFNQLASVGPSILDVYKNL